MKVSKDFDIREFVPQEIWDKFGANSVQFIDKKVIDFAQYLRDKLNKPITINNWHIGGNRHESGFRLPDTTTGAKLSQHKFGRAIDIVVEGYTGKQLRDFVIKNKADFLKIGMTTIEQGTEPWLHVDCRQTNLTDILFIPFQ